MKKKRTGLIAQIYLLVVAAIIILGVITQVSQLQIQRGRVRAYTGVRSAEAAGEVISSLKEYPAYAWLLGFWADHASELDIEYDADFSEGTVTEEKSALFSQRHPDLQLRYCSEEELASLPEEDQRLYAEIVYSWMITRINAIKKNYGFSYLYVVKTDTDEGEHPYASQLFIMSGAEPGSVRGTAYENVYILGVNVDVRENEVARSVMREAVGAALAPEEENAERTVGESMKGAGNYLDYYTCLALADENRQAFLVGSTYNVKDLLRQVRSSVMKDTLISMMYQFLLLNLIMVLLLRFFLNPLQKVLKSIRSYTNTKDSRSAEKELNEILTARGSFAIRRNEIGQLSEDFVALTTELDDYTAQIEQAAAERERIGFELETAAQIQLHMLPDEAPQFPDHPEFELCASMVPAKTVGGDFYDYFLTDDHHLALVMADVSDKGIPAALFMAESKALIKIQAQTGSPPSRILEQVNGQLSENGEGRCFVTVWLAIIDLRTGEGVAANAGHEHPMLCRKDGLFETVVYRHSPVVGMLDGITYRQHDFRMNPGDCLFVYTDGVPEAANSQYEQFGVGRTLETLNRCKDKAPGEMLASVNAEINAFMDGAARFDDTTMMVFRYKGRPQETPEAPVPEEESGSRQTKKDSEEV